MRPARLPTSLFPRPHRRHRVQLKEEREAERLGALTSKLAAKEERVAAMEAEKAAMLHALQAVHKEIEMQEDRLR